MSKLGYIVPEFPGQTHIFFWREIQRLEQMGLSVDIISTRPPPSGIKSHTWSVEAEARTTYLQSGNIAADVWSVTKALASHTSGGWLGCLKSIARSSVPISGRGNLMVLAGFGAKLATIASERQWRHMHVHSCGNAANVATYASILSGVPYSLTLHGPLSDYGANQFEKWDHARFGIAITRNLFQQVQSELGLQIANKTAIAPMGVNIDTFRRAAPYVCWNGEEALRLYSVGRLNPCKGHDHLIRATRILIDQGINVRLEIAGQDESGGFGYYQNLRVLIDELGLGENVKLVGAVSEEAVQKGIMDSHIFVLASLAEPLGVAIMEAMALETPVIATDAGGVPELIDHGVNGILVPPGDARALSEAIETLARDRSFAKRLSAASRQKIEQGFQDTMSAQVLIQNARLTASSFDLPASALRNF